MKRIYGYVASATVASALMLSGCGADSDAACAYAVEQNLDAGKYDEVISALDNNGTCNGALSQEDAWTNLAGAYLGKAGITLPALAKSLLDSNNSDPMAAVMELFSDYATGEKLTAMNNAIRVYGYMIPSSVDCADTTNASALAKDACFYKGMADAVKTASIMSAALGDATTYLTTTVTTGSADDVNNNGTADEMEVTACAIADANVTGGTSLSPKTCSTDDGSTTLKFYDEGSTVTFTGTVSLTLVPRTFVVTATVAGQNDTSYYRLIDQSATPNSPISTNGVCKSNYTTDATCSVDADINYTAGCYPCPIVVDGGSLSTTTVVVDAINSGAIPEVNASSFTQDCIDVNTTNANNSGVTCNCDNDNNASNITSDDLACYMLLLQ